MRRRTARRNRRRMESPPVDSEHLCGALATFDETTHHALWGNTTPPRSVGSSPPSHSPSQLLGCRPSALANAQARVYRPRHEQKQPGSAAEYEQSADVPGIAIEILGQVVGDVDARARCAKEEVERRYDE